MVTDHVVHLLDEPRPYGGFRIDFVDDLLVVFEEFVSARRSAGTSDAAAAAFEAQLDHAKMVRGAPLSPYVYGVVLDPDKTRADYERALANRRWQRLGQVLP
jgi:hypothetical protein